MFVAFLVASSNVYVYQFNGSNFSLYQNITMDYNNLGRREIHMTDDHQHLVVAGGHDQFMRIYQLNGS